MSGGLDVLALNEEDVTKMLAATTHLGSENVNFQVRCTYNLKIMSFIELFTTFLELFNMMIRESVPYKQF